MLDNLQNSPVHQLLMSIPKHSGPDGFEGLVAYLLSNFTGLRFHISKSGDQHGVDSATFANIRVGLEAKHYGATEVKRKEVVGGCTQAFLANRERPLDIWVLAATTHADARLCQELNELCRDYHCCFVCLDYSPEKSLHLLEVLCADQAPVLKAFVDKINPGEWDANVDSYLGQVVSHPDYAPCLDGIRRQLVEPTVGYDAWAKALKLEVHETLVNPDRCKRFLGFNHTDLLPPLSTSVRRKAQESKLSDWWASSAKRPTVILGEEGTGKSWGCLYWLLHQLAPNGPPFVPIPSRLRTRTKFGIIGSIANICSVLFDRYSESEWIPRLTRWARGNRLWCLPYLDGLLERETQESLADLLGEDSIPLLASCRTGPWKKRLSSWTQRQPHWDDSFVVLDLDDTEFGQLCDLRGLDCGQFSLDTLELMRKPRYFDLSVRVRSEISEDYLVTPDLLLALDWEDRITRSDTLQQRTGMDREAFRVGIQRLCSEYNGKVESSVLGDIFGVWEDARQLGQILSDEDIFRRDPSTTKWTVNPYYLVLGVGLAMAEQVEKLTDDCDFEAEISRMLEPAPEMDRKAQACGIACSATWRRLGVDSPRFASLLKIWLAMPNANVDQQKQFLSKIPNDVSLQPKMETAWESTGASKEQELLLERLYGMPLGSYRTEATWIALIDAWVGIYLESGFPTTSWLRSSREEVVSQIGNYRFEVSADRPWCRYLRRLPDDNRSLLRLRFFALDLIHRLPDRKRFADRLVAWLVASSLNQAWQDESYFIWVVETHHEELWPELSRTLDLLSDDCPVEKRARHMLMSFIDTQGSQQETKSQTQRFGTFFEDILDPSFEINGGDEELRLRIEALLNKRPYSFSDFEDWLNYGAARDLELCRRLISALLSDVVDRNFETQFKRLLSLEDFTELLRATDLEPLRSILAVVQSEDSVSEPRRPWAESLLTKFIFVATGDASVWQTQQARPEWQLGYGHLVISMGEAVETDAYQTLLGNSVSSEAEIMNCLRYFNWFPHEAPEAVAAALELLPNSPNPEVRRHALGAVLSVHPSVADFVSMSLASETTIWTTWEERPLLASLILRTAQVLSPCALFLHCPAEVLLAAVKLRGGKTDELKKVGQIYREVTKRDFSDLDIRRGEIRPFRTHYLHICYPVVDEPSQASPYGVSKVDFREWWGGARPELEPPMEQTQRTFLGKPDSAEFERQWRGFQNARERSVEQGNPWLGSFWDGSDLALLLGADPGLLNFWLELYRDNPEYLRRFPQLYESIFEYLLTVDATEALHLYKALIATPTLITMDERTDLPVMVHKFWRHWESMPEPVWQTLWNCESDFQVFQQCVAASIEGALPLLKERVRTLLMPLQPLGLARALFTMRFAGLSPEYQLLPRLFGSDRWDRFNDYLTKEELARLWYRRFLESDNTPEAAANLHCFLRVADYRFHVWRAESEALIPLGTIQERLLFHHRSRLEKCIRKNSYKRYADKLFGLTVPMFVRPWFG